MALDFIGHQRLLANLLQFYLLRCPLNDFTMANSLCSDDAYQTRTGDPWDENSQYAPTPGYFGRTPTIFSPSPAPDCATDQVQSDQLDFLPLVEWDEDVEYDEQPPRYICYTIA